MILALSPAQWLLAALAALIIGFAKTGVTGIGILAVALFALAFPTAISPGIVLPLLIVADLVAAFSYKKHAVWSHVWRLFPWAALGIIIGYGVSHRVNARGIAVMMGVIFLFMVAAHLWRRSHPESDEIARKTRSIFFAIVVGTLAGFTTMVANAAGPIMVLYLLTMQLPKMEFMGTGAWYYLILNCFKVPFQYELGNITAPTLRIDLWLLPVVLLGAMFGRFMLPRINQKLFEDSALFLTVLAALKLLIG